MISGSSFAVYCSDINHLYVPTLPMKNAKKVQVLFCTFLCVFQHTGSDIVQAPALPEAKTYPSYFQTAVNT